MQKETLKKRNYIIGIDLVTILYIKENLKIIKLKYYFNRMEKIIKEAVISFTDKEYIQLKIHITSNLKNTIYDTKKL